MRGIQSCTSFSQVFAPIIGTAQSPETLHPSALRPARIVSFELTILSVDGEKTEKRRLEDDYRQT